MSTGPKLGEEWSPESRISNQVALARYNREKAERRRKRAEALEMSIQGFTAREIAAHQGCSVSAVNQRLQKAYKEMVPESLVAEARKMVLDRCSTYIRTLQTMMGEARQREDVDAYCKLQAQATAVHDRIIRILGLDAPKRVMIEAEVTEVTEQDRELREMIREAQARNAARKAATAEERTE